MPFIRGHVLLADIGATNARFSLLANGMLGPTPLLSRLRVSASEWYYP
jgi:glucokinase